MFESVFYSKNFIKKECLMSQSQRLAICFFAFIAWVSPYALFSQNKKPIKKVQAYSDPKMYKTTLLPNEQWWGGFTRYGMNMPYNKNTVVTVDMWANNDENQTQPLFISNKGRYIWCEDPIKFAFDKGQLTVSSRTGVIQSGKAGEDIQTAYKYVSAKFFPPNGKIPDPLMFTIPQYNTWIELKYDQEEDKIMEYAQNIIAKGYPPGILMIDDTWQENYGVWQFAPRRFKDPKGMVKKLHDMGFKVMLWICPFVSADSETFRHLARKGMLLLRDQQGKPVNWNTNTQWQAAVVRWWNGYSGLLDLTNPDAMKWFNDQLDFLVKEYGVDGFKLDAGDGQFYKDNLVSRNPATPNDHTMLFGKVGLKYDMNEYRASFKMAGTHLAQRLRDKAHNWEELNELIPGILSQGMMGYAYTCPDMIGGGQWTAFLDETKIDQELIVRSAQIHALMPMMQFSVAPWRVLSKENNDICLQAAKLHAQFGDKIVTLARQSAQTGEPIARPLIYNYPKSDYGNIKDQFMLGTDILVAPVVQKGARSRSVVFPQGTWVGDDGSKVVGPTTQTINVPLERLPYYELEK
jgi:alpha-glucosidase (family GH31 glycosyl hydrolase)